MKAATSLFGTTVALAGISIHAAREGGDRSVANALRKLGISIHAAREGGDVNAVSKELAKIISIHAAREGGDGG